MTQLFADEDVQFAGQQVGVIVARTQELADQAADLVKIFYKDAKKPVLDVREVAKNNDTSRIFLRSDIPAVLPKRKINIEGPNMYVPCIMLLYTVSLHVLFWNVF